MLHKMLDEILDRKDGGIVAYPRHVGDDTIAERATRDCGRTITEAQVRKFRQDNFGKIRNGSKDAVAKNQNEIVSLRRRIEALEPTVFSEHEDRLNALESKMRKLEGRFSHYDHGDDE